MKILILSDLHNKFPDIKNLNLTIEKPNLILVAGDLTNLTGRKEYPQLESIRIKEYKDAIEYIELLNSYCQTYFIEGNHDILPHQLNITDRTITFKNNTIVGMNMSSCYDMPQLANNWQRMTSNQIEENAYYEQFDYSDIIVSHCPPIGELAITRNGNSIGSKALLNYINTYQPKIVICGHVHEQSDKELTVGKTKVYNVAETFKYITI